MNQRLQNIFTSFNSWCNRHNVNYLSVCDEDGLQGYLVPRNYDRLSGRMIEFLERAACGDGLFFKHQRTRSGTVLAFSLLGISENTMDALIPMEDKSRLARRLDLVFNYDSFVEMDSGNKRQSSRRGNNFGVKLADRLTESLDGIAAPIQPREMLRKFERALSELGLLDALKAAKISNSLSSDNQTILFHLTDADGQQRNIAAYELVSFAEGNKMEEALSQLRDLAENQAPGSTEKAIERLQQRKAEVRDVAKKHAAQPGELEGGQAQPLAKPAAPAAPAATPQRPMESRLAKRLGKLLPAK